MYMENISDTLTLYNGVKIPGLGFGVWQISPLHTAKCVKMAIKAGYRNIDTAEGYMNERSVGEAVRESGIPREEIWVTSKMWSSEYGEGRTMEGIDRMLERLDIGYIDLLLLHQQVGDYMAHGRTAKKQLPRENQCSGHPALAYPGGHGHFSEIHQSAAYQG